jgi:hypothetical protein
METKIITKTKYKKIKIAFFKITNLYKNNSSASFIYKLFSSKFKQHFISSTNLMRGGILTKAQIQIKNIWVHTQGRIQKFLVVVANVYMLKSLII